MQPIVDDGVPDDADEAEDDSAKAADQRVSIRASDKRVSNENEYSDSEDEGEGGRRNNGTPQKKKMRAGSPTDQMVIDEDTSAAPAAPPTTEPTATAPVAEKDGENKSAASKDEGVKNGEHEEAKVAAEVS